MSGDNLEAGGLDERFRRALDSIFDLVVCERAIRDDAGEITDFVIDWMNDSPVDVAGRRREELIGRRISELYPVLAGGDLIAGYRRVVETGEPMVIDVLPYEDVIDGRTVSGYYTVQASRFEDGVIVASRDITPLERSRRDLETALQELEAAQRLARLGTWRLDLRTGTLRISRELRRLYGADDDGDATVAMQALARRIPEEDLGSARAAFDRAVRTRRAVVVEHRIVDGAGAVGHVRSYAEPVLEDGEVVGLWGTTQDVTERVVHQDALDLEHSARLNAERLAGFGSLLSAAEDRQAVADAAHTVLRDSGDVTLAVMSVLEEHEPVIRQYFGGPGLSAELEARYRRTPLSVDTPVTRAATTDRPVLLEDRAAQRAAFPALIVDPAAPDKTQALAAMPLTAADGTQLGAFAIGWRRPRELDPQLVATLREIAAMAARTIERLDLRDLERSIAQTLQLSLLAMDLQSTRVLVRARYRAAEAAMEVGGDWYDAVELDDGRLAVAVGDVVGRGLPAATTMGQLRAALGVTSLHADDAADAVHTLDRYTEHVPGAMCATVAFALIDPERGSMTYVTAGHPPPLMVAPDGTARFLDGAISWPLGVDVRRPRGPAATVDVPAGSLLVFYTDGLIERRSEPIEVGMERLRDVVSRGFRLPLRLLKQTIFAALVDEHATDDIALVAVRMVGATPFVFSDAMRADSAELAPARGRLRAWLESAGVGDRGDDVVVAVGEALANAVEHGSTERSKVVRIEATVQDGGLIVSVTDSGEWQPGLEGFFTGRGRGHLIMYALADDVDVDGDQHGTIVTLRFAHRRTASVPDVRSSTGTVAAGG